MRKNTGWFVIICWMLMASRGAAQDDTTATDPASEPSSVDSDAVVDSEAGARMNALEERLASQEERITTLEAERVAATAREQEKDRRAVELEEKLDATQMEMEEMSLTLTTAPPEKKLNIYGFFDTTFYKAWYQQENSVLRSQNPPFSTFMMSHVNIYFSSQMTETLSALVETGFSFSPNGYETNLPVDAYVYNEATGQYELAPTLVDDSEYQRVDTTIPGGITSSSVRYGSVSIVRAHLDWRPRDWLNLRVGQYLTPYGIWNVEHASTVLLGVYYPHLMNWDLVPPSQLGLQAFGDFFLADVMQLNYALTLSNGRGPISSAMDLDENKGMGARIQTIFSGNKWKITAGSYGYYGKYTDAERRAEIYLNSDLTRSYIDGSPLGSDITYLKKFQEYIITADLSVEVAGLRVFGELVHRKVHYLVHPVMNDNAQFVQVGNFSDDRKAANHYSQSAYAIVAYQLPISAIEPVLITPYVGVDWLAPDDPLTWFEQKTFRFGLNVQPSAYVAIKTEGIIDNFADVLGGRMTSISAQLAVSF